MSNHDLTIANGPGINVRQDIEAALQALGTTFQGTAAPLTIYPCQMWADSSTGLLKMRNVANTAWITLGPLDTANLGYLPLTGGTITGNLTVNGTTTVAALNSGAHGVTGALNVSAAGTFGTTVTAGGNYFCNVAAGQNALYFSTVAGARQWYAGAISNGAYFITDATAGVVRLSIDATGLVSVAQGLSVGVNAIIGNRLDVSGPTYLTSLAVLTAPNGAQAYYHSVVTGTRDWIFGTQADGSFLIYDATGSVPRLTINSAGTVNINQALTVGGSLSAGSAAQVTGANGTQRTLQFQTGGSLRWFMMADQTAEGASNAGSNFALFAFDNAGASLGPAYSVVRATRVVTFAVAIVNPSDSRLKSDVEPVAGALDLVEAMEGVYYRKIAEPERRQVGLIAQDVRAIFPEVVFETAETNDDGDPVLGIEYGKLVPLLVNAVKELNARITTLEGAARQ